MKGIYMSDTNNKRRYLSASDIQHLIYKDNIKPVNAVVSNYDDLYAEKGCAKCPHCGESYYMELSSWTTAAYSPPIYKDGVNINPNRNITTTECECLNCGKNFNYKS